MSVENNPLKKFFRRPAVYVRLPSEGKDYPPGIVNLPPNGEIPVYPMTALDEIVARTPDALFNGAAVVELIKSCVPDIKDPWAVSSNDLDAILLAIRAASGNDSLEIESACPACTETNTYTVNLVAVLSTLKAGDYAKELQLGDLSIKFRPLCYKEMNSAGVVQFEIQKTLASLTEIADDDERNAKSQEALKRVTELTIDIISKGIEYINTPTARVDSIEYIKDFLSNCDRTMYIKIRDHNAELKLGTQLKPLDIDCANCHHKYQQPFTLNPTDFFV